MRLAMFRNEKDYASWLRSHAEAIEENGLKLAEQELADAIAGKGKAEWFDRNGYIAPENQENVWVSHLDWLEGQVNYLKRKVKRLRRQADKVEKDA